MFKIYTLKDRVHFSSEMIILFGLLDTLPNEPPHCYNFNNVSRYGDVVNWCKKHIEYVYAGINDWGGISPVTKDFINPQHPWPNINLLETMMTKIGFRLIERLTVYPKFNTPNFLSSTIRDHMAKNVANFYPKDNVKELISA